MKYIAEITIMPLKEILDPQGKAVKSGLSNLGIKNISEVRIGKHISLEMEASSKEEAEKNAEMACKKLLANLIMENYSYVVKEA
ncbi:MAG: phosphoribosylformylglycinamidine synthase subunit PurS [Cytophagaceae bacterium]|nr:phosphoribosylformylglycinamidine synthase subunit PurS [Cytophagaceae bacterium]MDW8456969.1 phosphoribosylformylglycinamidine synthase subunit PurS [Cytophagaceae bacterium]